MTEIVYARGDLFAQLPKKPNVTSVIPHVCNNIGKWGSGFVVPLGDKFPEARNRYRESYASKEPLELGEVQMVVAQDLPEPPVVIANMIGQDGVSRERGAKRAIRYNKLVECMDEVGRRSLELPNPYLFCPQFGAGLAGGQWEIIEELIRDCWLRLDLPVTVFLFGN